MNSAYRSRKDYLVFASAHFITFAGHRCEGLHGHNYRVGVTIEGELERGSWFVFDFVELKRIMRRLCDEIDHLVLLPLKSARVQVAEEGDIVKVRRRREAALRVPAPRLRAAARSRTRPSRCWRELLTDRLRAELETTGATRRDGDRDGSRGELRPVGRLPPRARADAASRRRDVGGAKPAVVERRRDERAVAAGIGEPREIVQPANTAASQQRQPRAPRRARARSARGRAPRRCRRAPGRSR